MASFAFSHWLIALEKRPQLSLPLAPAFLGNVGSRTGEIDKTGWGGM